MKYLSRIFLIIIMFFISLSANAFFADNTNIDKKVSDTISAVQVHHQDFLNTKDNDSAIQNIQRNDGVIINGRKSDNSCDGGLNKVFWAESEQLQSILAYIYTQSYLRSKSDINFSVVFSEIHPNAP